MPILIEAFGERADRLDWKKHNQLNLQLRLSPDR